MELGSVKRRRGRSRRALVLSAFLQLCAVGHDSLRTCFVLFCLFCLRTADGWLPLSLTEATRETNIHLVGTT